MPFWSKPRLNEPKPPGLLERTANRFFSAIEHICNNPYHLQRLGIIGSGFVVFGLALLFTYVVNTGFGFHELVLAQQMMTIIGNALYIALGLLGLVIVALLGIIRGIKANLPGGASFEVDIKDSQDDKKEGPDGGTAT